MTDHSATETPTTPAEGAAETTEPGDFIRAIVADDLASGKHTRIATRFPPEPNGYLHIGHAKSICLNFGVAAENGGTCNLRFDDSNPETEEMEYVDSIQADIRWLGFEWNGLHFASDYFEALYERAEILIRKGLAYVDSLSEDEIRAYRGTVTEPGRESPYRDRSVEENLDLFRRMRAGELPDGAAVLRAKIDMAAPNMKMRDPLLYRIRHADHYRRGSEWSVYPLYDFTHCLSDSLERITHSFCTLEFENNREIYDWILDAVDEPKPHPRQIEFARLNLSYTVLSKRRLLELVREGRVEGWDDPRMPTLSGLRRRGVPPAAIRDFSERVGVARADNVVDYALLEHSIRDALNTEAPRVLAVLDPLKVVIENYPEGPPGQAEELEAPYFPRDVGKPGSRSLPFSRELWIERDDFSEDPPKGYHRLAPGREVRLYDRLFTAARPSAGPEDYRTHLNPESLVVARGARIEPSVADAAPGSRFQFERQGFFYLDPQRRSGPSAEGAPVFNRIVTLRDSWARQESREAAQAVPSEPKPAEAASGATGRPAPPPDPRQGLDAEALERFEHLRGEHGLDAQDARLLAEDPARSALFEAALARHDNARGIANWIVNDLLREAKERPVAELPFGGAELAELVALVDDGTLSTPLAREVFARLVEAGGSPREIAREQGLEQVSDAEALAPLVARVLAEHPEEAGRLRAGEAKLLGYFVGQVMRASGGKANPAEVKKLVQAAMGASR